MSHWRVFLAIGLGINVVSDAQHEGVDLPISLVGKRDICV
jgi:hypothetical protein